MRDARDLKASIRQKALMQGVYSDIRIVDVTRVLAGPYATMILAQLGAEVIKVEAPDGEDSRRLPPFWGGESTTYLAVNQNKKSVALDLKQVAALESLRRIIDRSDVFIESFKPGTAERLGLGYDELVKRNPKLIYCSISAFGPGPLGKDMPGYDALLQAFSGILKSTGHPGQPPARIGPSAIDLSSGMWATIQIMAALAKRERATGPQKLEVALIDASLNLMCHQVMTALATGRSPEPQGSGAPSVAPYEVFQVGDGELMVAAGNDKLFRQLCREVGLADLPSDPRFCDMAGRVDNRNALHAIVEERLKTDTADNWLDRLGKAGVPAGRMNGIADAIADPLVAERALIVPCPTEANPDLKLLRLPLGPLSVEPTPPPSLGQHTEEILLSTASGVRPG